MTAHSASEGGRFARARRREIARACAFGARTKADIARLLADDPGSVSTMVDTLVSEGILRPRTVTHATGRAYEFDDAFRPELVEAIGSDVPRGQVLPGSRLLVVAGRNGSALTRVALALASAPVVMWIARVDGPARFLVATRAETPEERTQVDQLEGSIADEGLECVQLRVDRVLELSDLTTYARSLARKPRPPQLPAEAAQG
jgi:hypothetical protein